MDHILSVENLNVTYSQGQKNVLHDINFNVPPDQITCIVGESGSGKTTLVRAILGLLPKNASTSGKIYFNSENVFDWDKKKWQDHYATDLGYIFQSSKGIFNPIRKIGSLFKEFLIENGFPRQNIQSHMNNCLKQMGFHDVERVINSYSFQLSGGMLLRINIAMALSLSPTLLIADEPTSGLDVAIQSTVVQNILSFQSHNHSTILMISHNIGLAAYAADYILVMKQGEIVEQGLAHEVIHSPKHPYTKKLIDAVPTWRKR